MNKKAPLLTFLVIFLQLTLLLYSKLLTAQNADSLVNVISSQSDELSRQHAMVLLAHRVMPAYMDSALTMLSAADKIYNSKNPVHRADYYNGMGLYFWYKGENDQAIDNFKMALDIPAVKSLLPKMVISANNIGSLYSSRGQNDSAMKYLSLALDIDKQLENEYGMTKTMYDLGVLHMRQDHYEIALKYFLEVYEYQTENIDSVRLPYTLITLGNTYLRLQKADKAIENYKMAADLCLATGNLTSLTSAYNNLSSVYSGMANGFDSAIYFANRGLEIARVNNDFVNLLSLNVNSGNAYLNIKDYMTALKYFNEAHTFVDSIDRPLIKAGLYVKMGEAFRLARKFDSARYFTLKALDLSKYINSMSIQRDAYFNLASLDSAERKFHLALENFQHGTKVNSKILNQETASRIAELEILYETKQKESAILHLTKENKVIRLINYGTILVAVLLVAVLILIIRNIRNKEMLNRQNLKIQQQEAENIKNMLEANRKELTAKALAIAKYEDMNAEIRSDLKEILTDADAQQGEILQAILNKYDTSIKGQQLWKDFETRFNEVNDGFISKLTSKYPSLSPAEIRLCAMLRMQLSSKEIAELSSRSHRTIEYTRTNIRRKMSLNPCDNLTTHLLNM